MAGSGLAGAVIRLAGMLWPNPRRYQVRVWVERSDRQAATSFATEIDRELSWHFGEDSADSRKVTVDLSDPQTGASIATRTLLARNLDVAAEVIAGYVARQIFKADPPRPPGASVPSMVTTSRPCSAHSNCGCPLAARRIPAAHCGSEAGSSKRHYANNASAGVARHELALLKDLEGGHVAALRLHAINREQYRRFYRSRYRVGMSLEMMADPAFRFSEEEAAPFQDALRSLDRVG